ncbi:hypothetical protein HOY34_04090 [Xinfangfangia sp. D13-10-4-6]|uniref:dynamin family protein n=1 Tax=Pseudogemmobacter hezensis TaxID=2737662 RepID=UPI001554BE8A|nr:dynamin family protein [Pseudogemmobacter hezensis]NPD14379.1 hypothetical protein [Pseudogemmobacter hezensis]
MADADFDADHPADADPVPAAPPGLGQPLAERAPRKPGIDLQVVVCGEVSSGKSTLLNTLLLGRMLPDNLGAATRPGVVVTGGGGEIGCWRQDEETLTPITDPEALRDAALIHVATDLPHLDGIELIEMPLTTAEAITAQDLETVRNADALIWVTIGSQAWRLTERRILDELHAVRPARGLIVISRADKLRNEVDRDKIIERVRCEAASYYPDVMFLGASRQALEAAASSDLAWAGIGGSDLALRLMAWREEVSPMDVVPDVVSNPASGLTQPAERASGLGPPQEAGLPASSLAAPSRVAVAKGALSGVGVTGVGVTGALTEVLAEVSAGGGGATGPVEFTLPAGLSRLPTRQAANGTNAESGKSEAGHRKSTFDPQIFHKLRTI